jgi:branched-chain amino acid transport system permease protein
MSTVFPGMGDHMLILSFVVVVLGGIGSVTGAAIGALLIGLTDTFGKVFFPSISSFLVYFLMATVLLWRPNGILGQREI